MKSSSDHNHVNAKLRGRQGGDESLLPLAIRQRLWDQIWVRLLTPPADAGDRAPIPKQGERREGGPQ